MGRFFVEKMVVPALQALREPKEQIYLGLTLATVLVLLFGPGGVTTRSQANRPGSYTGTSSTDVFAKAKPTTQVVQPDPKPHKPDIPLPDSLPTVEPEPPKLDNFAKAKPTTTVVEPEPKPHEAVVPLSDLQLLEEHTPAK